MGASTNPQLLKTISSEIGEAHLAARGFKIDGSTFRREMEPGFTHIIEFGLGPSWSIERGNFTVDICVFVKEAYEIFFSRKSPRRPTTFHCELRQRLGMLRDPARDQWWALTTPVRVLVSEVGTQIQELAIPFLDQLGDRRAFVNAWRSKGSDALGLPPRGNLVAAIILQQFGDHDAAAKILDTAIAESTGKPTAPFVAKVAERLQGL